MIRYCIELMGVVILTSLQTGERAIDIARREGHNEVVRLLLQSGAQVSGGPRNLERGVRKLCTLDILTCHAHFRHVTTFRVHMTM